jgi:phosphatidylglycerophosphate synthase
MKVPRRDEELASLIERAYDDQAEISPEFLKRLNKIAESSRPGRGFFRSQFQRGSFVAAHSASQSGVDPAFREDAGLVVPLLRQATDDLAEAAVAALGRARPLFDCLVIHPYWLICSAAGFTIAAAVSILIGNHAAAVGALALAGFMELLDGTAARKAASPEKAMLLDALADRISDAALFGALGIASLGRDDLTSFVSFGAMFVTFMSSYARAEAGALGFVRPRARVGRIERLTVLLLGLSGSLWFPNISIRIAVTAAAVLALLSLAQRLKSAFQQSNPGSLKVDEFRPADGFVGRRLREIARNVGQPLLVSAVGQEEACDDDVIGLVEDSEEGAVFTEYHRI